MKTLPQRLDEVLGDPELTSEQATFFEKALRDTFTNAQDRANKSIYLFLLFAAAWFLIRNSAVAKFQLFGLQFERIDSVLLLLPAIAGAFFYNFACLTSLAELSSAVLRHYYVRRLPLFAKHDLTELLIPPSFNQIENALANLDEARSFLTRASDLWLVVLTGTELVGPIFVLVYMLYSLIATPVAPVIWSAVPLAFLALLIVRSVMVLVHGFRAI
jgi:uncharacterized integral membrane protein